MAANHDVGLDDGADCPCGTGRSFGSCCQPVQRHGAGLGITAEQLMRARYTAYAIGDAGFLERSWHPDTRPPVLTLDPTLVWTGLTVIDTEAGSGRDSDGVVSFQANFVGPNGPGVLAETSRFTRVGGRWVYLDGR